MRVKFTTSTYTYLIHEHIYVYKTLSHTRAYTRAYTRRNVCVKRETQSRRDAQVERYVYKYTGRFSILSTNTWFSRGARTEFPIFIGYSCSRVYLVVSLSRQESRCVNRYETIYNYRSCRTRRIFYICFKSIRYAVLSSSKFH